MSTTSYVDLGHEAPGADTRAASAPQAAPGPTRGGRSLRLTGVDSRKLSTHPGVPGSCFLPSCSPPGTPRPPEPSPGQGDKRLCFLPVGAFPWPLAAGNGDAAQGPTLLPPPHLPLRGILDSPTTPSPPCLTATTSGTNVSSEPQIQTSNFSPIHGFSNSTRPTPNSSPFHPLGRPNQQWQGCPGPSFSPPPLN